MRNPSVILLRTHNTAIGPIMRPIERPMMIPYDSNCIELLYRLIYPYFSIELRLYHKIVFLSFWGSFMRFIYVLLFVGSSLCAMESQSPDLFLAKIARGDVAGVGSMIAGGHNPRSYEKSEPLVVAFSIEDQEKRGAIVQRLLEEGADPNGYKPMSTFYERRGRGFCVSLLGYVAGQGWDREVRFFLLCGADPDGVDSYGETVLARSLRSYRCLGHLKKFGHFVPVNMSEMLVQKLLLMYGADPAKRDRFGINVLDFVHSSDVELKGMVQDFEAYRAVHKAEFAVLQDEFADLKAMQEYRAAVRQRGLFNVHNGIYPPGPHYLRRAPSAVDDRTVDRKRKRGGDSEE